MPWHVLIADEAVTVKDPEGFVKHVKRLGMLEEFIEATRKSLEILEALAELEERGFVERTEGTPTSELLFGTKELLRLLEQGSPREE